MDIPGITSSEATLISISIVCVVVVLFLFFFSRDIRRIISVYLIRKTEKQNLAGGVEIQMF